MKKISSYDARKPVRDVNLMEAEVIDSFGQDINLLYRQFFGQ
jgi:hypothetical protein